MLSLSLALVMALTACSGQGSSQDGADSETDTPSSTQLDNNTGGKNMTTEYYIFELSENVNREHITYINRFGITLAADLYTPADLNLSSSYPAVVVGAPYGGVKEQGPGVYANELAQRGFVVITFDPSYNGYSEGEPRRVSSPEIFTEDFSAGVDYLGTLSYVDREQIGAIGICGSGGFALSAAQVDTRIKAVVTASIVDISGNAAGMDAETRFATLDSIGQQRWADAQSGSPEYIPAFPTEPATEIPEGLDPMSAEFFSFRSEERRVGKECRL